ncbi:hypothetical protein HanPI659440_Chr13g0487571 [Helianthus annuus]|nr:hypothetical protein HanPI659440_Chr13g0487571 [Helianthus annuus]
MIFRTRRRARKGCLYGSTTSLITHLLTCQTFIFSTSIVRLDMAPFQHIKPHAALKHHSGRRYGGFIIHPMICIAPDTIS